MNKLQHFKKATEIWTSKAKAINFPLDITLKLEAQKKLLNIIQVGDFYCYIFNLRTVQLEYISDSINSILGYPQREWTVEDLFNNYHPDDLPMYLNSENKIAEFFASLPPDKIHKYKARYDIRVRKANGEYIRILQQIVVFESNAQTNELKAFGVHTDISHLKTSTKSTLSFIGMEGEPSYIDVNVKAIVPTVEVFSKREKELLKYLVEGMNSKEIGALLHLSSHTVDTHRRNILKKTQCKNITEMVGKALSEGWI
jgi:DNA-binding CsgD family transcriptional regulator